MTVLLTRPAGATRIAGDLTALGLRRGATVVVHSSLRAVGPLADGPATLLAAIQRVIGDGGTVVVPTETANNSTTTRIYAAATAGMDAETLARHEAAIPAFDRATTPSHGMGAFAEHVRTRPNAVRSGHPQASFAALGADAERVTAVHDLDSHLGERSPMAALYATGADVLLLGVGFESCTVLHLAEHRLPWPAPRKAYRCYVMRDGERTRTEFEAPDLDDSRFGEIGVGLGAEPFTRRGRVGAATARILPVRDAVDYTIGWFTQDRRRREADRIPGTHNH